MPQRLCPRCHTTLNQEDSGTLIYCGHCGAPQVRLSEALLADAEKRSQQKASSASDPDLPLAAIAPLVDPTGVDWSVAVRLAGLAGAISLGLSALASFVPPVSLLSMLWALAAPIVLLGMYSARCRQTRIMPGFGARLGMLGGLAIACAESIVNVVQLFVRRFVLHRAGEIDTQLAAMFSQLRAAQVNQPTLPFLSGDIPEFRVGLVLSSVAFAIALYLAYCTVGGAFGGFLRARSKSA